MKIDFMKMFDRVVTVVFGAMMLIITLGMIIGVFSLFVDIRDMLVEQKLTEGYLKIISGVLTLFIMIELLRSIVEYFSAKRLRMTFIVDAALVFVLREIMIKLFEHKIEPSELYAMSALILVLTVLRMGSMLMYQRDTALGLRGIVTVVPKE
ncbi:MAG: phosphate-starvation-inducible PsiE family protein [Pseudomonadota bacterium]